MVHCEPVISHCFTTNDYPLPQALCRPTFHTKTAIVTGAAQGIGRSIAIRLASDGFAVVISDVASKQELMDAVAAEILSKNAESQTLVVLADVSSEADVNNLVAKTKDMFGGLDVVSFSLISLHVSA